MEQVIKETVGLGLQLKSLVNVAEETSSSFKRPPGTAQELGCGLKELWSEAVSHVLYSEYDQ